MSWFHELFINDVKGSLSGTGCSSAIIDVLELPTENIQPNVLYRYMTATFMDGFYPLFEFTCKCVDSLPRVGEPATDVTLSSIYAYYNATDNSLNGYVNQELSMALGVPVGWYPAEALFQAAGVEFAGIYTTYQEAGIYLLVDYDICTYENAWVSMKSVGMAGTGFESEVFNGNHNTASGIFSHAEGYRTTASGDYSHAEGYRTTASGDYSHAEGNAATASGGYSHAEGDGATASGDYSHAEGIGAVALGVCSHAEGGNTNATEQYSHAEGAGTIASGYGSHAEGLNTVAAGSYQHVQGKYNILDQLNNFGKYAHIVGNGQSDGNRSNAHTLDWDGNAWYAGSVECTKTILKSPNGTRFEITVGDDGTIKATAI